MLSLHTYLLVFVTLDTLLHQECQSFTCQTPNDWQEEDLTIIEEMGQNLQTSHKRVSYQRWPNGQVIYRFNETLPLTYQTEIVSAFHEFQKKTCVRFVPHQYGDAGFVTFQSNKSLCGKAHVCKNGGEQFVWLGEHEECWDKETIIHEIGHTLCLRHEHQRIDRGNHIKVAKHCDKNWLPITNRHDRFYDYFSQMHYECNVPLGCGVPIRDILLGCGRQVTKGLSMLDADHLNDMYNCGGCYRHRWIPIGRATLTDIQNLPDFGFRDMHHRKIYVCRGMNGPNLIVGTYFPDINSCYLPYNGNEYKLISGFEVLSIPGDLMDSESHYSLVDINGQMTDSQIKSVFAQAVPAGRAQNKNSKTQEIPNLFVALGMIKTAGNACHEYHTGNVENAFRFGLTRSITLSSKISNRFKANLPFCGKEVIKNFAKILVCKPQLPCNTCGFTASKKDLYKNWSSRHTEYISNGLSIGSTITIVAEVFAEASAFYIDLTKHVSGGPLVLHLVVNFDGGPVKYNVFMNTLTQTGWGKPEESRDPAWFGFKPGQTFTLDIRCEEDQFVFRLNGREVGEFRYGVGIDTVNFLRIHGDITVLKVAGLPLATNCSTGNGNGSSTADKTGNCKKPNTWDRIRSLFPPLESIPKEFMFPLTLFVFTVVLIVVILILRCLCSRTKYVPVAVLRTK